MKQVKFLFIAIIGMMVTTVTAKTTAKLEKKQKIESVSYQTDFENVVNEFVSVDAVQVFQSNVSLIKTSNDFKIVAAFVKDVGWHVPGTKHTSIHYKEKLLENYNLNFINNLRKQNLSIRSYC